MYDEIKSYKIPANDFLKKRDKKSLHNLLWNIFSVFVRLRDCYNGSGKCVTCDSKKFWRGFQGGHYKHGKTKATYFDERNVHAQCPRCNKWLNGNGIVYAEFILEKYGVKVFEELKNKAKKPLNYSKEDYINNIILYDGKVDDLLKIYIKNKALL